MKHAKFLLALLLVVALFGTMFAACATSEDPPADNTNNTNNTVSTDHEDEEIANINFWYFDLRMTGADHGQHVEDAINAITEKKINTHVDVLWYTVADYGTNLGLALAGGDQIDLMQIFTDNKLADAYAQSQVMDITELMNEYAPETLELVKDYIGTYSFNGKIYGVPTLRNYCSNGYIIMRKDILDELGLTEKARNMTSWTEYEEILAAVSEAYKGTGLYAVSKSAGKSIITGTGALSHGDSFADYEVYDTVGDTLSVLYLDNEGNVSLYQAQQAYVEELERVKAWADNGWVYPDSAITDIHGDQLLKQGVTFSNIQGSEVGIEVVKGNASGYELVCPMTYPGMITSGKLTSWGCAVPITAEEPAAAVKFINLLYTDAEVMNLLTWGVEGVDYNLVDGQVQQIENKYKEVDFLIGNNLMLNPLYGNGADFYERVKEVVDNAPISPFLGFALQSGELEMQISQITAVNDQYAATLCCGGYTPELYEEYLTKLEAAGVQEYLDEVQNQLNAWRDANK